jgi:hypothetical protein
MTQIVFAVIDNHKKRKGTTYDILYKTKSFQAYVKYLTEKGLVN